MASRRAVSVVLLASLVLVACAPAAPAVKGPNTESTVAQEADSRSLVVFIRVEPSILATRGFVRKSAGLFFVWRIFNALPALVDARGAPQPELLTSLPSLNTDDWQVFPDGTMQTRYALRPNLTWHDGAPLTSEDFVFAWRVFSSPELGLSKQPPMSAISEVETVDERHFVIRWKALYPDADSLSTIDRELPPLPQHILAAAFDQLASDGGDSLVNHPSWGPEYVGLGPYRLQGREPGSSMEAVRFDGYALGAPKIPRIQLRFSDDQNVVVAHMLSGDAQVATDSSIGQAGGETLTREWAANNGGTVFQLPSTWRYIGFQLRPELASPRAVLDLRVRKAVAHAIDKQAVSDAAYSGQAILADTPIWSGSLWGAALDDTVPTYPFDPRAAERLLNESGFSKGADGFYRGPDGQLSFELSSTESPTTAAEIQVTASQLQAVGLETQQRVIPRLQAQDPQVRASFPAMQLISTLMDEPGLDTLASAQIPSDNNRWIGGNRGAWSSPAFDRLLETFNTTLSRADRVDLVRQMLKIYGQELPRIAMYFPATPFAYVAALRGPMVVAPESRVAWNIHEWEFKL